TAGPLYLNLAAERAAHRLVLGAYPGGIALYLPPRHVPALEREQDRGEQRFALQLTGAEQPQRGARQAARPRRRQLVLLGGDVEADTDDHRVPGCFGEDAGQ